MPEIPWGPRLHSPASWSGRACRAALFLALAILACLAWEFRFAPQAATDGLIYHLTLPARWLHEGYLAPTDLPFHDGAAQYSPMLSQTLFYVLMLLTGDDGLIWLVQPAFLLLTLFFFFRSARLAGLGRSPAAGLTAALALFPPFLNSAMIPHNELIMTAGFALVCHSALAARRRPGPALAVGGAGLALMLGTKVVGAIHAAAALPLLAAIFLLRLRRAPRPGGRRLWGWAALAAGLVAAGSFFLLRNWALYGNPLYPAVVRLGGIEIFPGRYDYSVLAPGWPSGRVVAQVLLDSEATFGIKWWCSAALWLGLAVNLGLLATLGGRRRGRWPLLAFGVLFPLLATAVYFRTVPFREHVRLIFPVYYALFIGLAGALAGLSRLRRPAGARAVAWLLPALVAAGFVLEGLWFISGSVVVGLLAIGLSLPRRPSRRQARLLLRGAAAVLGLAVVTGPLWYPAYSRRREEARRSVYARGRAYGEESACWESIDRLTAEVGALTVAYSGTPHVFPLFGPRLANRPVYVPISPDDRPGPTQLAAGEPVHLRLAARRRARIDEEFWLAGLRDEGVSLLLLVDEPGYGGGVAPELSVVRRRPELFRRLLVGERVQLLQFMGPGG